MKAITYTRYGGPEQLKLTEVDVPRPGEQEVLVKVHAVSLNDWDLGLLTGDPINRMLNGWRRPKRKVLGSDISGIIVAVGSKIKKFKPGDAVYGDLSGTWGGLAEYVCAAEKALALKPASMRFDEAAAIPQAGMLAVQGLIDCGKILEQQKILINGAGGGVGMFGVQLANMFGAELTGVDHSSKLQYLREIGFHHTLDYTTSDFTRNINSYDIILDVKTNRSPLRYLQALTKNGVYVTVGGSISRMLQLLLLKPFARLLTQKKLRIVSLKPNKDLAYFNQLFEEGKLKPLVDGSYRLEDYQAAFQRYQSAGQKGKIVITIIDGTSENPGN